MGSGFIDSNSCEIPLEARPENGSTTTVNNAEKQALDARTGLPKKGDSAADLPKQIDSAADLSKKADSVADRPKQADSGEAAIEWVAKEAERQKALLVRISLLAHLFLLSITIAQQDSKSTYVFMRI